MKNIPTPHALLSTARLSLLTTALTFSVQSAPLTWNSAGPSNNWSTAAGSENWNPGGVVWAQNSDAVFNGSSGTPESISVTTTNTVNDITFAVSGFGIGSAGAGSLVLANDLASTITVTNLADSASIAETIANNPGGASSLTKAGLGTLTLNGTAASTYSGGTIVSAGTLAITQTGALGTGIVSNAATLDINVGNSTPTGLATGMSGAGTVNVTLPTGTNTTFLDGDYSGFTGTWNIGVGAAAGAGKVQMNGADNAAATINVLLNGTVLAGAGTHNASITLNGGDTGESLGQLRLNGTTVNWAGPVILAGAMNGAGDGIVGTNSGPSLLSGTISETGGPRELTKSGGGTLVLGGNNSYTGATRVLTGNISVTTLNNTGNTGNVGTNSTIALGSAANGASLLYTGTGETTDRVIDLAGTTGGGGINQAGTGLLKFTSNLTATGAGIKTLTLNIASTGTGEIAGQIVDNSAVNKTNVTKNGGLGTLTLSGSSPFTGNVAVNTGDLVITNPGALGVGPKTITVVPTANPSSLPSLVLDGSAGDISLASDLSFTTSFDAFSVVPFAPIPGEAAIINTAGNNTIAGNFTAVSGGGSTAFLSNAGTLTLTGQLSANTTNRNFIFRGDSNGTVSGPINNGSGSNSVGISRDSGSGIWTLSGGGTYSGATAVSAGTLVISGDPSGNSATNVTGGTLIISGSPTGAGSTTVTGGLLKLDYGTNDTSKLADFGGALIFNGGTLELAGGTHVESVSSTTLNAGKVSTVTRSSGDAVLELNFVTPNAGALNFAAAGIATTDSFNVNGFLPWARFGSNYGMNATDGDNGPIVPYTGGFADVTRLGGTLPDGSSNNVRIVNGGASGTIGYGSPVTTIGSLLVDAAGGPAVIDPPNSTDILSIGQEAGGILWHTATSGGLTLGTTPNNGVLTTGGSDDTSPATLTLLNDSSTNPVVINSSVANNGSDPVSLLFGGPGSFVLAGNNTFTGSVGASGTSLTMSGSNVFTGPLTISSGSLVTLSGDNSGRPAGSSGLTIINNGATLQLQANAGNTAGGLSTALSPERTALQPLTLNNGGLLQLRSDDPVTFTGGNSLGGLGSATVGFDVNQLTGAGSGNTLTVAPLGFDVNTTTLNVTGGNGFTLGLGKLNGVSAAGVLTLNPTTANLAVNGYSANATLSSTIVLGGTATENFVTGAIVNPVTSGATTVTKNGTSTWTLGGANTYTGTTTINDGTLKSGAATAFNNLGVLAMAGPGVLDLNGFDAAFTNVSASAATNTITDNSAGAGQSVLAISNQTSTISALIANGATRTLKVNLRNANTATTPFAVTSANTFSGGLTLQHTTAGTRLRISAAPVTVGAPGAIVSSPFGTGPITIGEVATDKAGILLDTAANFTIANAIVFNTILGTDQPGIRLDTAGHVFSGRITANLSDALFARGGTGTGAATLTGQITGPKGLQLSASPVSITLNNATANPNNYDADTTLGTGSTLVLGSADQIPNGALKGSVATAGTLNLGGFSETINGLSGAGTVTSTSGAPVLTLGDNNAFAIFSGATGGSLALTKIGSGTQILSGVIGHSGDTTVSGGSLQLGLASTFANSSAIRLNNGATLNLAAVGEDVVDKFFIDGVAQATGVWGRLGGGAPNQTARITGEGRLSVTTSGGGTPFSSWISGFFPSETNPAIIGQTADPDKDGVDNITEFAFAGDPSKGGEDGKIYVFVADSDLDGDTNKELILTAAVRTGAAAFGIGAPSTAVSAADGITYWIQGSTTLADFTATVNPVPTAITTDLPPAGDGYSYRSFSLGGSNGLTPAKGFLRATVTAP
ncbi:beta strand repeat-containing protein [Luteolibacter sp. Populi]|uniref:beta strand repeat-containing protein n=1 Tax=Luteolibacter sp. Populi TaxID=3230487 RepID=UPI003466E6FA